MRRNALPANTLRCQSRQRRKTPSPSRSRCGVERPGVVFASTVQTPCRPARWANPTCPCHVAPRLQTRIQPGATRSGRTIVAGRDHPSIRNRRATALRTTGRRAPPRVKQ
jgi:hypothetical protein